MSHPGLTVEFAPGFGPFDEIGPGDWVDLSDRLLSASWSVGRDDEFEHFPAGTATIIMKNEDRELDPDYTAGTWFGELLPRVPFRLRSSSLSLDLPGATTAYASTPDIAAYAITDLDVTVRVALDDWTPSAAQIIAGQSSVLANIGWTVSVTTAGRLELGWSTAGTFGTIVSRATTNPLGFTNGAAHTLRITNDVNDGGGNRVVTFYVDGVQLEQFTTAGTTTIFNSTAQLQVSNSVGAALAGRVYSLELRASIGGAAVANPDFTTVAAGATSFVDDAGRTWTVNGTAAVGFDDVELIDMFYGFVDGGWEQDLDPPGSANCTVKLFDKLGILAGYTLPDVFSHGILELDPVALWILDGPSDAEAVADLTGNGHDGSVRGTVNFGEPAVISGHGTSARIDATTETYGRIEISRSPLIADPSDVSLVATFRARSAGSLNFRTLFIQDNGSPGMNTGFAANIDLLGQPQFEWVLGGGGIGYELTTSVVDGEGHILFGQSNGMAIDTAVLSTTTASVATGTCNGTGIGGYRGIQSVDHWDGWIGTVAVFDFELTQPNRETILDGFTMLDGQTTGEQIDWALDRLAIPAAHRNIDTGTVTMGPASTAGADVLEWIRGVVATEQGGFYVDHRDGGKLRFTDRYTRFLESRSTSSQASFSDDPAALSANVVRVERGGLDIAPNGTDSIINQATVKWRDGEETVEDSASVTAYGPRTREITTQATTPAQARSVAEWLIARYAEPRSTVRGIGINPGAADSAFTKMLDLRIDDLVDHRLHPQQVGAAVTTDLFIEGISHKAEGLERETHYDLSPAETFTPWIWGTSEWGNNTYWG